MTIFGVLLRLLTGPYSYLYYFTDFKQVFFYVGTLSILIGGILGLLQWTVKRFFAATSINNMGFILICLSSPTNIETALYYLFIYNSLLILTFALLSNT
jgi:NADH:ubiquinone oxidoreductase subunit 2 (subunit N)